MTMRIYPDGSPEKTTRCLAIIYPTISNVYYQCHRPKKKGGLCMTHHKMVQEGKRVDIPPDLPFQAGAGI